MEKYVDGFKDFVSRFKRIDFSEFVSFDISSLEFIILDIIADKTEMRGSDSVWVCEIVDEVQVTAQAVSKNLKSMENKGFIERFVNKDDRRITGVRMLEEGKEIYHRAMNEIVEFLKELEKCFEKEEMEEFIRLSKKFTEAFFENMNLKIQQKTKMEDNKV